MLTANFRRWMSAVLLTTVAALSLGTLPARADEDSSGRKVKTRVQPMYPDLARKMNLAGVVKIEVVIATNGNIKSTKVIGGHPVLVESALNAVRRWRYEASSEETTTTVEFRFNGPEQ